MNINILKFLKELANNNTREWFNDHKEDYLEAKRSFEVFINELIPSIRSFDPTIDLIEAKDCTFRIYRDVRFSKDKSPYKTNMGAYINRGGRKSPFAGYYVHVEPGQSFLAGGIYMPHADILKKIREEIMYNYDDFLKIINNKEFKDVFGELDDPDKLINPPKGFPSDFAGIEMLKLKSYAVMHHVKDEMLTGENVLDYAVSVFKVLQPLNNFFNTIFISE